MTTWRNIIPTVFVSVALTILAGWLLVFCSYRLGYRDGLLNRPPLSQTELDSQCAAWWTDSDLKDAKTRLCTKGK